MENEKTETSVSVTPLEKGQVAAYTPNAFEKEKQKNQRTWGWKAVDAFNYVVLGFLGNVGVSLLLAKDELKYKAKKEFYSDNPSTAAFNGSKNLLPDVFHGLNESITSGAAKLYKKGLDKIYKPKDAKRIAEKGGGFTGSVALLSWGGTLLFIPIYFLERAKPQIVRGVDKVMDGVRTMIGRGPDQQELEERQHVYEYLDSKHAKEPFLKLLVSRYFSVGIVIAAAVGTLLVDPKRKGLERVSDGFMAGAEKYSHFQVTNGKSALTWLDESTPQGKTAKRFAGIAAVEVFGSGITAISAYLKIKIGELTGKRQKEFELENNLGLANISPKADYASSDLIDDAITTAEWTARHAKRKNIGERENKGVLASAAARVEQSRMSAAQPGHGV